MLDFITIGGATRDIFFNYEDLKKRKDKNSISGRFLMIPYGEKIVSKNTFYAYGGGAVNSAVAISRLGGRVASVCNIGKEGTGSLIKEMLRKERVNTSLVSRDARHHTGLSIFILGNDNEHSGFLERGANNHLKITKMTDLGRARWLYITSLTGASADILDQVFSFAKRKNIKICFNPGSEQLNEGHLLKKYIKQTEILILNVDEAEKLVVGSGGCKKIKNRRSLFSEVENLGARISVVTDGCLGSHAVVDNKVYSQPAIKVEALDTTGAGDSFGATFSFCIQREIGIADSLKMAAINSASVVSFMGAQSGLLSYNKIRRSEWL